MFKVGCHVSARDGVYNAPKYAYELGCETFQIFSRPPQGGKAPELGGETVERFQQEMKKYGFGEFVIHCPYFVNFGSSNNRIYHGSISVVRQELERGSILGAKYVMTHLGTFKDLGFKEGMKQVKEGLKKVLEGYDGKTKFLLEIAAGAGKIIGDRFEEIRELTKDLAKVNGFGGVCFDTQHAFASGYDLRDEISISETFKQFDQIIGLEWLKMSHMNDSQAEFGSHRDRHEHIGEGKIGVKGFEAILRYWGKRIKNDRGEVFPLILETKHDKVEADIKFLKGLRDKIFKK